MNDFLLDTNIISEINKKTPNLKVRQWFESQSSENSLLWISVISIGEMERGVRKLALIDPQQSKILKAKLEMTEINFSKFILPIDFIVAMRWGELTAKDPTTPIDALIAATALAKNLTVVTRNVKDFEKYGVQVLNPF